MSRLNFNYILLGLCLPFVGCMTEVVAPEPETKYDLEKEVKELIAENSKTGSIDHFILPEATDYENLPQDPRNPITHNKVVLGKYLFYETGLLVNAVNEDGMGTASCATCHMPNMGFKPGGIQGIGDGGEGLADAGGRSKKDTYNEFQLDVQGARAINVLNVGFLTNTSWNGQFGGEGVNKGTEHLWNEEDLTHVNHIDLPGLEVQLIETFPLHRMHINREVVERLGYKPYFDVAFSDVPLDERYSDHTAALAVASYLRCLVSDQAPFQKWLKGDQQAMSTDEIRGAKLFFGKAGCVRCHAGPGFSDTTFFALGVHDLYQTGGLATGPNDRRNLGRGGFTLKDEDLFKFKTPGLYNVGEGEFFFHGSSKRTLREVVEYKNAGIPENSNARNISPMFSTGLDLTEEEIDLLVLFLEKSLTDDNVGRHVPPFLPSNNCFPNADELSKEEMGCQ